MATFGYNNPIIMDASTLYLNALSGGAINTGSGLFTAGGNVSALGSILSSSPSAGIGYANGIGAGGTVSQPTTPTVDKNNPVALNKIAGQITTNTGGINPSTGCSITLTNSSVAAADVLAINLSGGTAGAYTVTASCAAGSATIIIRNVTGTTLSETLVLRYVVIKGANS